MAALMVCSTAAAQTISVGDVEMLQSGHTSTFVLHIQDAEAMTSMHFELNDPSGKFAISGATATTAWAAIFSAGSEGVSAISTSDKAFSGEGDIASIELTADASVELGTYAITLTNVRINGKNVEETTFNVTVSDYITLDETSDEMLLEVSDVNIRLKRTIKANEWSTICLPFTATGEQVKAAFGNDVRLSAFTGWESEEDDDGAIVAINVTFTEADAEDGIEANTPMLIMVSEAVAEATFDGVTLEPEEEPVVQVGKKASQRGYFYGTYVATKVPEENLFLSGNKFWYSTGATSIKAFRGFFEFRDVLDAYYDVASVKFNLDVDGVATQVNDIHVETPLPQAFDLSGRRVSEMRNHGVYIINGKKIMK